MGVYDQAARYVVKRSPAAFFRWRTARFHAAWNFLGWLDTSRLAFPGEPDRICDTVGEFERKTDPGQRCILDVEFQSEPHSDMLERLGEYAIRLRRELRFGPGQQGKYTVISLLLNLTGPAQPNLLDMRIEELENAGLRLQPVLGTLPEENAAATLERIKNRELDHPVLPWIPLMHGGGEPDIIEEWKRLAEQEADSNLRSDYGGIALVFAELADVSAAWRRALEGWNVRQSQQVLEWQNQARAEGKAEGQIKGQQSALLRVLQRRFLNPLSTDLVETIIAMNDLDVLARWLDAAVAAASLESFRASLHTRNGA